MLAVLGLRRFLFISKQRILVYLYPENKLTESHW